MGRIKKTYMFNPNTVDRIEQIALEKNLTRTNAIEHMIDSYFTTRTEEHLALMNAIKEQLNAVIDERMAEDLKRTRVTANVIDKNTQMMMEFWNHYFVANDFKMFATTETYKAEEVKQAEQLVLKRIAHNRERKINREKKMKNL